MSELFEKSIRTLELPAILKMLSEQTNSEAARAKAMGISPSTDRLEVERLQEETDAAREMIGLRGSPAFSGIKEVSESLYRADRGGALNTRELLDIAGVLRCARRVKDYWNDDITNDKRTAIDHLFRSLKGNRFLEEKIITAILDEDELADNASPELADIRRHKRNAAAKGRQILQKIISSQTFSKVLQEAIITQRDGRFVVPVKAEQRGNMPGLVHDDDWGFFFNDYRRRNFALVNVIRKHQPYGKKCPCAHQIGDGEQFKFPRNDLLNKPHTDVSEHDNQHSRSMSLRRALIALK